MVLPLPDIEAYIAPLLYKSFFTSPNIGRERKTLSSKSFLNSLAHVSMGCATISLQHFFGVEGVIPAYASFVYTATPGLTRAKNLSSNPFMLTGLNLSPMPSAYDGTGLMKKAQSAPNLEA